jgi:DNA-binding MarR family transcriptional regulator
MANDLRSRRQAQAVADRLHSAALHLLRGLRRHDASAGLGPARLSALSVLVFGGPTSLARLAAAEQVTPPTMSRVVAALRANGLVARRRDPGDRRRIVLEATPAGRRVLRQGRRRRVRGLARRLRPLSAAQLARLAEAAALIEEVARRRAR